MLVPRIFRLLAKRDQYKANWPIKAKHRISLCCRLQCWVLTAEREHIYLSPKRQFNVATWSDLRPHWASDMRDVWHHRKWNPTDHILMAGTRSNAGAINGTHPWSPALWYRCNASTARAVVFKLSLKNKVSLTSWKNNTGIEWYPGTQVSAGYPGIETGTRVPVPSTRWDSQCQTDARQLETPCSPHYVGSANNYHRQTILKVLILLILGRWEWEQTWQKFIPQRQDNNGGQLLCLCMLPFLPPSFLLSTLIGPVSVRPLGLTTIRFNSRRPGVSRRPLGMESYTCRPIS